MASPAVVTQATDFDTTGGSISVNLPASLVAGNLILIGAFGTLGVTSITGFTEVGTAVGPSADDYELSLWAKEATGSEGATVAATVGAGLWCFAATQIEDWSGNLGDLVRSTGATGNSANPDPDTATAGASADHLAVAFAGSEDGEMTGFPAGYGNTATVEDGVNTGIGIASLAFTGTSANPGTFTCPADPWAAFTVLVLPVGGGGGTDTVALSPTAQGAITDVVDEGDATSDLWASVDDLPSSPSDSDWNNNTDDAGQTFYLLTDMPSDFDEAQSATITVRYRGQAYNGKGTVTLYARLYQSDESTALSDEVQVAAVTADSSFGNTSAITLTGLVASDKTTWDGARLRLRWERTNPTAFPVVEGVSEDSTNTAGTSHQVTLPAGIEAADETLILMDIGSTSATLNALTDWEELLDEAAANGLKILHYIGAGVPSDPTFTSSANTRDATIVYRISGADKTIDPQIATTATGTSATPDPPSVTPAGGTSKDYLFIAFYGAAGEEADDDTWSNTPPTNYTPSPPRQKSCGTAGTNLGGLIASAERSLTTGAAQNPGTFAKDVSAAWRAQHVIVHPLPVATVAELQVSGLVVDMTYVVAAGPEVARVPRGREQRTTIRM
jgi:hypothetical protein